MVENIVGNERRTMKTQFDTEKGAQAALEEARYKSIGFCPLINTHCVKDCVCYHKGDIGEITISNKHYWAIRYPYCTNVLISGQIEADCRQ